MEPRFAPRVALRAKHSSQGARPCFFAAPQAVATACLQLACSGGDGGPKEWLFGAQPMPANERAQEEHSPRSTVVIGGLAPLQ